MSHTLAQCFLTIYILLASYNCRQILVKSIPKYIIRCCEFSKTHEKGVQREIPPQCVRDWGGACCWSRSESGSCRQSRHCPSCLYSTPFLLITQRERERNGNVRRRKCGCFWRKGRRRFWVDKNLKWVSTKLRFLFREREREMECVTVSIALIVGFGICTHSNFSLLHDAIWPAGILRLVDW